MDDRPQVRLPTRKLKIDFSIAGSFQSQEVTAQADQWGGATVQLQFLFKRWSVHFARPMLESIYHTLGAILDDGQAE